MAATQRGFTVRALGEVAIRCANLPEMTAFYRDVVGLEPLSGEYSRHIQFFRIGSGFGGHTTIVALFHADEVPDTDHSKTDLPPATGRGSSLHHLALTLPFAEQQAAMDWLRQCSIAYRVQEFAWIGWRGVFFEDPEGNTIEFVAYDPASGIAPG